MRIIMGAQNYDTGLAMANTLEQLAFAASELTVVHAIEPPGGALGKILLTASEGEFIAQYLRNQGLLATTMGEALVQALAERHLPATLRVSQGSAGEALKTAATEAGVGLICLYLQQKGSIEGLFGARVARQLLAEAKSSLLVCRPTPPSGSLRHAVFASDHSPYADRCVDRLIELAPQGIDSITVLTSYQRDLVSSLGPFVGQLGVDVSRWVSSKLHEENLSVIEKLRGAGWTCHSEVREGTVHEAIDASMVARGAGLLILGAQGHGFVERLTLGSVSLHETLYGRFPLLILRS